MCKRLISSAPAVLCAVSGIACHPIGLYAQDRTPQTAGEVNLALPDLTKTMFFGGINEQVLLMSERLVVALGLLFGLVLFRQLKNLPVHKSMLEISELIYETGKTYLVTQGKPLISVALFMGLTIIFYFGILQHFAATKLLTILIFPIIGIGGSFGVAWFGTRVNTWLFGLLAVDLAASLSQRQEALISQVLSVAFLFIARYFAGRSFYRRRIAE